MNDERPSNRMIERTMGYPTSQPPDPGAGLRGHLARSRRRPPPAPFPHGYAPSGMPMPPQPQPEVEPPSMLDVRGPDGTILKSYFPDDEQAAISHAQDARGMITIAEIVADYRQ